MTEPLYHFDAYVTEFDAHVTLAEENAVALDRTAFFPGGGGQPCDVGTLVVDGVTLQVIGVKRRDGVIWHELGRQRAFRRVGSARRCRLGQPP